MPGITNLKSQWEFDDLFTTPPARRVWGVTELTSTVKRLLQQQFGQLWVGGEITNLRLQSSGHLYFSLKDGGAQLNCVLFRGDARGFNRDLLKDGASVNLQGELTVYEARGQYQLIVSSVELQGVGALQAAFEKLKQKLQAEGLFAAQRKRPLPRYPRRIGVVTSSSGAALRDVLHTIQRRHPALELILASCRVQGQGASEEVACAIRLLNEWSGSTADVRPRLDLILVTRGGGSLEDLWAFNEEVVARAIFESTLPIVSAIGHEIDFTISDFVADLRAATPTSAAEIITEGYFASRALVSSLADGLSGLVHDRIARDKERLDGWRQRLGRQHPRRWLNEQWQRLDDVQGGLGRCVRHGFRLHWNAGQVLVQRLLRVKPSQVLARRRELLDRLAGRLTTQARLRQRDLAQRLLTAEARLRLLSPLNVLDRGYSITVDAATGHVLRQEGDSYPGQELRTRLKTGEVRSIVPPRPGN